LAPGELASNKLENQERLMAFDESFLRIRILKGGMEGIDPDLREAASLRRITEAVTVSVLIDRARRSSSNQ
jgi:hypothetical protein